MWPVMVRWLGILLRTFGCAEDPRRAVEARPDCLAGDGVAKYMVRPRRPPSQAWRTFLKNHTADLIALDFFTVPTATFRVLFVLVVLTHSRRRLVHFNVTEHPTAEWTARQLLEVRAGGGAPVSDSGPRPSLWRTIFASGPD